MGERLRARRRRLGMSQTALAERLGLTFQQVQKYERGANRVSASKLYDIATALGVPVGHFFEGLEESPADAPQDPVQALLLTRDGPELAAAFPRIRGAGVRRSMLALAKALADEEELD